MPTRLFLAAALLVVSGCAGDAPEADADGPGEVAVQSNEVEDPDAVASPDLVADVDTTGPAVVTVAGTSVPARGVVTDLESGDRSCTLTLRTDDGATETMHADYSVCDTDAIVGRRVQVEYAEDALPAASCEGDPTCLDLETVALAVVADPID